MMIHLLIFPTSSLPSRSFEAALCLPSFDTFCHQLHHSDDNHDTDDDHDSDNDHDLDDDHDSDVDDDHDDDDHHHPFLR